MGLISNLRCVCVTLFIFKLCMCKSVQNHTAGDISQEIPCPDYGEIEFATIKPLDVDYHIYAIHIECNIGYELVGRHKILCNEGKWEHSTRPQCVPQCNPPPFIENGRLDIEEENDIRTGFHKKGTLAIYSCVNGFQLSPPESQYRVCEKGIWTGPIAKCVPVQSGCKKPKDILNGYYVQEKNGVIDGFGVGQRLHYSCNSGYVMEGPPVQQCLEDGTWSPRIAPSCIPEIEDSNLAISDPDSYIPCSILPLVAHATMEMIRGHSNGAKASPGAEVEFRCERGYRNAFTSPCERIVSRCHGGSWIGDLPNCVPVKGCAPPPSISNGRILGVAGSAQGSVKNSIPSLYAIGATVLYQCEPGFEIRGYRVLSCSTQGCWEPMERHPTCHEDENWDDYATPSGTILVSVATASGVMLMLLAVCVGVACRRRKPWGRRPPGPASVPHRHLPQEPPISEANSAAGLTGSSLNDPDRLALIAFADQGNQQSQLPSYEEAIRERSSGPGSAGLLGYRSHRPHWTQHWTGAARRPRPAAAGGQPPADAHVTRQSSCTSHTPSMRSGSAGGDPMGSTDTMTPSEVSTNVTLDTVSSHSGSQPASCRAICGSLASFDTSSALNTEGVPLLEENETEETSIAETSSIGVEFRSVADNASFKYRRTSPDLA